MTSSEARRMMRKAGCYVVRTNNKVEVWTNGKDEVALTTLATGTIGHKTDGQVKMLCRRSEKPEPKVFKVYQAVVGARVRSLRDFVGIDKGTCGEIVEDYGTGISVEWLPAYAETPVRDGFDKKTELQFLELI